MLRHDFDYWSSPHEADYFSLLPRNTCFDFDGGAPDTSGPITAAIGQANALQKQMYDETAARNQPWTSAGQGAINYLSGMLVPDAEGKFKYDPTNALRATPGYQFARDQGVNALEFGAASRGNLLSGAQQKGLMSFGTGLADQTYQNYLSNLFNVSGQGLQGSNMTGQAGMNYANQAGRNYLTAGEAQAQNALAQYQARQSGYNSLGSLIGAGAGLASSFIPGSNFLSGMFGSGGSGVGGVSNYNMSPGTYNALGGNIGLSY